MSSSGASLRDVSILWDFPPHTELTKTNQSGHFTVKDNCESLSFSVTKKGYIPYRSDTRRLPDTHPVLIRLEDAGLFYTITLSFPSLFNISMGRQHSFHNGSQRKQTDCHIRHPRIY